LGAPVRAVRPASPVLEVVVGSLPLHPALVHIPLGLAAVIPLVALAITFAQWRRGLSRRAWSLVVGMQAFLLAGGLIAQRTGGADEERVESVVAESAIEQHEEAAEVFLVGIGATLALAALVLVVPARAARYGALAASLAAIGVAGLGIRVGHAGGRLVYQEGAAAAWTDGTTRTTEGGSAAADGAGGAPREEDDDR
jgi:uncharacterized membrane protein